MSDTTAQSQQDLDDALIQAFKKKDIAAMAAAVKNGANVNHVSMRGASMLLQATQNRHESLATWLLDNGADPSQGDLQGLTPMLVACRTGQQSLVKGFVERGNADLNKADRLGSSPLMEALLGDHTETALYLIKKKAKIDQVTRMGSQALFIAAERKNAEVVRALLAAGANPNCRDTYDLTPLISASMGAFPNTDEGREAQMKAQQLAGKDKDVGDAPDTPAMLVAQALIDAGADVNAKGRSGLTALVNASISGVWALCHALIDKGADVNVHSVEGPQGGYSPLMMAIAAKKTDLANKILDRNGEINYKNSAGMRAVDIAITQLGAVLLNPKSTPEKKTSARENFLRIIQSGGDLDARSRPEGLGLVHVAALAGDLELLNMALGDPKASKVVAENGETAAHLAVQFRKEKALSALLDSPVVDVNAKDKQGHSPLHVLSFNPVPPVLQAMLQMAATQAIRDNLVATIHKSSRSLAKKLLEKGADINVQDNEGWTPLLEAVRQNASSDKGPNREYLDFLVENGADPSIRNKNSDHAALVTAKLGNQELTSVFFDIFRKSGQTDLIENFVVDSAWTAPEHFSLMENYGKVIKWATEQGANIEALDGDGQKALVIAAATNQEDLVELLLQLGADVNGRNAEGETALMHAVSVNAQNIVRILLEAGADLDAKRNDGDDAWAIGYRDTRQKCIEMMREHRHKIEFEGHEPKRPSRYAF
jgi:ankyrin repeat protein